MLWPTVLFKRNDAVEKQQWRMSYFLMPQNFRAHRSHKWLVLWKSYLNDWWCDGDPVHYSNIFQRCSSTREASWTQEPDEITLHVYILCSMYVLSCGRLWCATRSICSLVLTCTYCAQWISVVFAIHWASAWRGKFCQLSHFFGFCVLAAARQLDAKSLDEVHQVFCQLDADLRKCWENEGKKRC